MQKHAILTFIIKYDIMKRYGFFHNTAKSIEMLEYMVTATRKEDRVADIRYQSMYLWSVCLVSFESFLVAVTI